MRHFDYPVQGGMAWLGISALCFGVSWGWSYASDIFRNSKRAHKQTIWLYALSPFVKSYGSSCGRTRSCINRC